MEKLFFLRLTLWVGTVKIAVDEVVDHADFVGDSEDVRGSLLQIFADGGDAVRFFYGKFGDGEIGTVGPDQSDIGAVQGGDEREPSLRCHLLRQQSGDRMRDSVVDVQQI